MVLSPLVVLLILFSPPHFVVASVCAVSSIMAMEVFSLFFSHSFPFGRIFCAVCSFIFSLSICLFDVFPLAILFSISTLPILSFFPFMFLSLDPSLSSRGPFVSLSASLYTGGLFGFSGLLYLSSSSGSFWLITLLVSTFLGDTGAYSFGRLLGGPKLALRLSPGKTWAGALGGVFFTTLSLVLCKFTLLPQISFFHALCFGPLLSISCQLGDLAESFLKRGSGVKDSGRLIPGHGGLLDRCDALLFSSPSMYLFFSLLYPYS
jgi:CDP-diglyceride synthetase